MSVAILLVLQSVLQVSIKLVTYHYGMLYFPIASGVARLWVLGSTCCTLAARVLCTRLRNMSGTNMGLLAGHVPARSSLYYASAYSTFKCGQYHCITNNTECIAAYLCAGHTFTQVTVENHKS